MFLAWSVQLFLNKEIYQKKKKSLDHYRFPNVDIYLPVAYLQAIISLEEYGQVIEDLAPKKKIDNFNKVENFKKWTGEDDS